MEEIVKASRSLIHYDHAAAFKLSERAPLPPPVSPTNLPGGHTQIFNVRRIQIINRHPAKCDQNSAPECNSETEDWHNWNGDIDNPNDSEEDCAADVE
jgi:hypothetical protein